MIVMIYIGGITSSFSKLIEENLAYNSLSVIENTNSYKYSSYTSLTAEQDEISADIINDIVDKLKFGVKEASLVNGCAGTDGQVYTECSHI